MPCKEEALVRAGSSEQEPALYALSNESLMECQPTSVEQVFVVRKSVPNAGPADTETTLHSLKSFTGTYMAADRSGRVTCASTAIGALEMWTPVLLPDRDDGAVAFKIRPPGSANDVFLSTDASNSVTEHRHTESIKSTPPVRVHARGTAIGCSQVFFAKCQVAHRQQRQQAAAAAVAASAADGAVALSGNIVADEAAQSRRFQSGRPHQSASSCMSDLSSAKQAGKYSEGLLDRREKAKSDRYCK
ncbi:hypothetical protein GGI20_006082 [Coemansia sp. BCRC 34301]|nr:hypothetical protein GGI20_006082 [Coemansia sp. BCRC 34301]